MNSIGLFLGSETPSRLDVIFHNSDLIAFNKPPQVAINTHPLYPEYTSSLIQALKQSSTLQKQELQQYSIKNPQHIYLIEPDISGVALISLSKEATEKIRNLFGSNQFQFTFLLLAIDSTPEQPSTRICSLPLVQSEQKQQMVVSHKFGKQAQTTFHHLESLGGYSLWSAHTSYPRIDQIRVHAMEVGLYIPGEKKYYQQGFIYLSHLKKEDYKFSKSTQSFEENPLYDALSLHLYKVSWKCGDKLVVVWNQYVRGWVAFVWIYGKSLLGAVSVYYKSGDNYFRDDAFRESKKSIP